MSAVAADAIESLKQSLSTPEQVSIQWGALTVVQRRTLLKSARLSAIYATWHWSNIPRPRRGVIRDAARQSKNTALRLEL